jgi:tetratricopeptide (TPR) repeat protein
MSDETNGQWTMILDNVDDVETFFPSRQDTEDATEQSSSLATYLPQSCNGSILITSRIRDAAARLTGGYTSIKDVFAMDEGQGLQLLRHKLPEALHEDGAMMDLLQALGYMPLAITQAAAYINRRAHMTIARYLSEFRANDQRRESLLHQDAGDLRRDQSASNSVVTTWQMSFERIRRERPSATELLSLMSFFSPQAIPEQTLREYKWVSAKLDTPFDEEEADRAFDEDLDTLYTYSLVTVTGTTGNDRMCDMHALVQFCTRVWLSSSGETERWKEVFIKLLAQEFPDGDYENWKQCQRLIPHVEWLYDAKPASDEMLEAWAEVLSNAAWYLLRMGNYQTAEAVARKAIAAQECVLGPDSPQTLVTVTVLAVVLDRQERYAESEQLNRRALRSREQSYGKHDYATLKSMSNLASVLCRQGKYAEAEKLSHEALVSCEREFGVWHPITLKNIEYLALLLQHQGNYEEAEKLNRRAMEGSEKQLGAYHPDTLISVKNLASVLHAMRRYEEAMPLYQRAYDGRVQELGAEHPDTISCGNDFARMKQEAEQAALGDIQAQTKNVEYTVNTTRVDASSKEQDKRVSMIARIKGKLRKRIS